MKPFPPALLVLVVGLVLMVSMVPCESLAQTPQTAVNPNAPLFTRPASPEEDLSLLEQQTAQGVAEESFWLERIVLYTNLGELATIDGLVSTLRDTWPQQPVFREALMIIESGRGNHEAALELGQNILRDFPTYRSIRVNLARVHKANGDIASAVNLLISAIETGPVRTEEWAFLLKTLGEADRSAQRTLDRLAVKVEANPQLLGLKYLQVVLYTRFSQYDKARDVLVAHPELAANPELQRFVADVNAILPVTPGPAAQQPEPEPQSASEDGLR